MLRDRLTSSIIRRLLTSSPRQHGLAAARLAAHMLYQNYNYRLLGKENPRTCSRRLWRAYTEVTKKIKRQLPIALLLKTSMRTSWQGGKESQVCEKGRETE